MKKAKEKQSWGPFWRVIRHNTPWAWFLLNTIATSYTILFQAIVPKMGGRIMAGEIFDMALVWEFTGIMILQSILGQVFGISGAWCQLRMDRNIQYSLWDRLMELPMSEYNRITPTSLISRVTSDTSVLSSTVNSLFGLILSLSGQAVILQQTYTLSHTIAYSLLLALPYVLLVMIIPGRLLYGVNEKKQAALSRFTSFVAERLMNIRLIKAAGTEEKEQLLGYEAALDNYRATVRTGIMNALIAPFTSSTQSVLVAIVLITGSILMDRGELGADSIITLYMYAQSIYASFSTYISTYHTVKRAQGISSVVAELMEESGEVIKREKSFTMPDADIVFDDVSFRFGDHDVLSHVNFTIPQGRTTAIVGPSGAGKTTILSLLERLYTPTGGEIRFGNTPIEKIHLDEWRRAMGYIQQESPLITGSIRDNIVYGLDREPSADSVREAARLANAAGFIETLPKNYETNIGQMGGKLSGGERQRVALARMIIKQPTYLLLDEATASLDAENSVAVQKALRQITDGKTTVIVAHDLSTICHADHIIVLDKGKVEACGDHNTLYAKCDLYRRYYDLMSRQDDPVLA